MISLNDYLSANPKKLDLIAVLGVFPKIEN